MAKSTHPITYAYNIEGAIVLITRVHVGTAYPRNGNVGNPTEYFRWEWSVSSQLMGYGKLTFPDLKGRGDSRADAYERARAAVLGIPYRTGEYAKDCVNVRPWTVVKAEMQANYRWQEAKVA